MTLWRCGNCKALFAVGLTRCPQCHGTDWIEEGKVPKISRSEGATSYDRAAAQAAAEAKEEAPTTEGVAVTEPTEVESETGTPEPPAEVHDESSWPIIAPKRNASKADWVEFAESQGYDDGDPNVATRDELADWWDSTHQ